MILVPMASPLSGHPLPGPFWAPVATGTNQLNSLRPERMFALKIKWRNCTTVPPTYGCLKIMEFLQMAGVGVFLDSLQNQPK